MAHVTIGPPRPAAVSEGATLGGDFVLGRLLGRGGMGSVYAARQLSTGRARAVKVLHADLAIDPRVRERFVEEARVPGRVGSPHLCETISAGSDAATGTLYIAMELLEGETLAARLARSGPLGADGARRVLGEIASGLAAAHRAGLVHRDLKPENVFLAVSGGREMVKILDFGVAKSIGLSGSSSTTMSVGSPLWMAPEQAEGKHVGAWTDVWAFGLVAFQVLTGETYWLTTRGPQATVTSLLLEILTHEMAPASARTRAALPPAFDAWFARCLSRDPVGRFPDAGSAWSALDPVLGVMKMTVPSSSSLAAGARPVTPSVAYAATIAHGTPAAPVAPQVKAGGGRGLLIALVVLLGVGLVAGGGFVAWSMASSPGPKSTAGKTKKKPKAGAARSEPADETDADVETEVEVLSEDDDACPAASRDLVDCVCRRKDCAWACPKGMCSVRGERGSKVVGDCGGGSCSMECAKGADCMFACPKGGCVMTCEEGAKCSFDCGGGGCAFECDPKAARCLTTCSRGCATL